MTKLTNERKVEHFISARFGKLIICPKLNEQYKVVAEVEVDPKTLGVFGFGIWEMEAEIKAAIHPTEKVPYLYIHFSYKHNAEVTMDIDDNPVMKGPSGSNGYRVTVKL